MRKTQDETQDATYKVLSLGMWLKLATDSRLMLLLLRVLRRGNGKNKTALLDRNRDLSADKCMRSGRSGPVSVTSAVLETKHFKI